MHNPAIFTVMGFNPTGDLGDLTFYTAANHKPVIFLKAPPTAPPTARQRFIRDRMAYHAAWWAEQTEATRDAWRRAAKAAHTRMTGYNLWQWWMWHGDRKIMGTIQRQANIDLGI